MQNIRRSINECALVMRVGKSEGNALASSFALEERYIGRLLILRSGLLPVSIDLSSTQMEPLSDGLLMRFRPGENVRKLQWPNGEWALCPILLSAKNSIFCFSSLLQIGRHWMHVTHSAIEQLSYGPNKRLLNWLLNLLHELSCSSCKLSTSNFKPLWQSPRTLGRTYSRVHHD